MDELNLLVTAIGAIILFLGLVSDYFCRNWWTSDPLTALILGIVLGPSMLGLVNPNAWRLPKEHLLEQTARFTMAIGLMGVALRLPQHYFFRHWKPLRNLPESLFVGWFGPVGVAAIFYAGFCLRRTGVEEVWLVCALMICASIVAQGLSATPLTKLYGQCVNRAHHLGDG